MNASHIIGFLLQFVSETAILTAALWIMIKLQKLNYKFVGLIVAAAIATFVEMVLEAVLGRLLGSYVGISISSVVVVILLFKSVHRITLADTTDVAFTIGVGYALTFCVNLFLLSSLLGDLRSSHRDGAEGAVPVAARSMDEKPDAASTNATAQLSQKPKATVQPTNAVPVAAEPVSKNFTVRGVTHAARPSIVLEASGKQYTLFKGDMVTMKIPRGFVAVQFKGLDHDQVVLTVEGEEVKLNGQ